MRSLLMCITPTDGRREDRGPQARRTGWRALVRENWYRDVWLFGITLLCLGAIMFGYAANKDRIDEIQSSRLDTCQRQNQRHDTASAIAQKRVSKDSRPLVGALVDALVPTQDCRELIAPPAIPEDSK